MTPVSVTSTANVDPYAATGGIWGTFTSSPVYNKPAIDFSNPLHIAAVLVVGVVLVRVWKKSK